MAKDRPDLEKWTCWPAPAKLNLFLRVLCRRSDGYHELQTVFRLLDWGDELHLRVRRDGALVCEHALPGIPAEHDLCLRAARLLAERTGCRLGASIRLDKRIPVGGGLGGGSSDAASTLVGLNSLWGTGLGQTALAELGLELGADVPVFVRGRSAWAEGVGEHLQPVQLPPRWYVLIDAGQSVSTGGLFQAPELTRNATAETIPRFLSGAVTDNAFEPLVRARFPKIEAALDWLGEHGRARLSGSGGCGFIELESVEQARAIARDCPDRWRAVVAAGVECSPLIQAMERFHAGA